jgi:hypothetical protein
MEQIGMLSGARVRWVGPVIEEPVTVNFTDAPLSGALKTILEKRPFLLLYSSTLAPAKLLRFAFRPV